MKKVYLHGDETVVSKAYLERMEQRAQAEEAYRRAVEWCVGYMSTTRRILQDADVNGDDLKEQRMRGRIEAITAFDKAVVQFASEADHD